MTTSETTTLAPAGTWRLDPVHSSVGFEIDYLAGTFRGEFREVESTLAVEESRANLSGSAKVASVDVKDENLAAHLQSPDFFDAERHPELSFAAERIALDGEPVSVDGEITIKGVTKPVTVTGTASAPLTDPYGNERIGFTLARPSTARSSGSRGTCPSPPAAPHLPTTSRSSPISVREGRLAMTILGISGSLRRDSHNTRALRAAADYVGDGVELEVWEGLKAIPPYDEDDDGPAAPAAVAELRSAIAGADAVLFATPEYNASIPGQLKNALDWVSRPLATNALRNKPVAVIGASTGMFGAVWSQAELRKVLKTIGARVVEDGVALTSAPSRFDDNGRLVDEQLCAELEAVLGKLVDEAHAREEIASRRRQSGLAGPGTRRSSYPSLRLGGSQCAKHSSSRRLPSPSWPGRPRRRCSATTARAPTRLRRASASRAWTSAA